MVKGNMTRRALWLLLAFAFFISLTTGTLFAMPVQNTAYAAVTVQPRSVTETVSEFVTVQDGKFYLRGEEFRFLGANNYYLHYKDDAMIEDVLDDAVSAGFTVIRMWGFFNGYDPDGNPAWMQPEAGVYDKDDCSFEIPNNFVDCWERIDFTLKEAAKRDLKIIIGMGNNWDDFGGVNQYLEWAEAEYAEEGKEESLEHSDFFTDAKCKTYYKNFVAQLINHVNQYTGVAHKDDPTIFAWELLNEPRNTYQDPDIVTAWVKEMGEYVQGLDANHLVALGDEGGFAREGAQGYNGLANDLYDGEAGVDFDAILALECIDFGTYHLYPETWRAGDCVLEWGKQWISDHIAAGKEAGKPVIVEEFGVNEIGDKNREYIYGEWLETVWTGGSNALVWMLSGIDTSDSADVNGNYADYDGFRLLYEGENSKNDMLLLMKYAKLFANRASSVENEKVFMITPYLSSRLDENGEVRALSVDGDATPVYPVEVIVATDKKVKNVEVYTNGEKVGKMKYNSDTGMYEYGLEMKYYLRGEYIDIEVVANLADGSVLEGMTTRIIRQYNYSFEAGLTQDYTLAEGEDYDSLTASIQRYSTPAYQAKFNGVGYSTFNGGAVAVDCNVDTFDHWCEIKLEVANIDRETELLESGQLSFDVYFAKDKATLNTGSIPSSAEAADTAPGFRNYAAIDPGWTRIGLNANNVKAEDLEIVTVDGAQYYKQTVVIEYTPSASAQKLVLGIVFNNVKYDGEFYIDDFTLYTKQYSGERTDGYVDRAQERLTTILAISIPVGIVVIGAVITVPLVLKKRAKNKVVSQNKDKE